MPLKETARQCCKFPFLQNAVFAFQLILPIPPSVCQDGTKMQFFLHTLGSPIAKHKIEDVSSASEQNYLELSPQKMPTCIISVISRH